MPPEFQCEKLLVKVIKDVLEALLLHVSGELLSVSLRWLLHAQVLPLIQIVLEVAKMLSPFALQGLDCSFRSIDKQPYAGEGEVPLLEAEGQACQWWQNIGEESQGGDELIFATEG